MIMVLPALIAGGASLLGGVMANRGARRAADRQMGFQDRMRSTEWQTAVKDMEAAGINPALAYSQGGASSPSGALAQVDDVAGGAVSSALQTRMQKQQFALMKEQREKTNAEAARARAEADIAGIGRAKAQADYGFYFNGDGTLKKSMTELLTSEHGARMANSAKSVSQAEFTKYTIAEQRSMAALFEKLGAGGKGGQISMQWALPILLQMMRR